MGYQGKPVCVAQTSTRLGGRFADKASAEVTSSMDRHVDEAHDLAQDLAYSHDSIAVGNGSKSAKVYYCVAQRASDSGRYRDF